METLALYLAIINAQAGSPSFVIRERWTVADPAWATFLVHSSDPEVVHRHWRSAAERSWGHVSAHWDARGWPWVDAIEGAPWIGIPLPSHEGEDKDWEGWKLATKIWAKCQIENGMGVCELEKMLEAAWERCMFWRLNKHYPP